MYYDRNTAMRVSGSGCIAELFLFFSKIVLLYSDCNDWQKTTLLHLFVHPMKMGGREKSVGKAMAQKGYARCKESI